jgi:hypothetical protein
LTTRVLVEASTALDAPSCALSFARRFSQRTDGQTLGVLIQVKQIESEQVEHGASQEHINDVDGDDRERERTRGADGHEDTSLTGKDEV